MLFFLVSCGYVSTRTEKTADADIDNNDNDRDSEFVDETEVDAEPDEEPDEGPENVYPECLDMRKQEDVIKTDFPFYDEQGKITLCRPGCDSPAKNDPQCVRNLMEWFNWQSYNEYLEKERLKPGQEWERECYPWPCVLPDMTAHTSENYEYIESDCDRTLTVNGFQVADYYTMSFGGGYGNIGVGFNRKIVEYDPYKDQFVSLAPAMSRMGFNGKRFVTVVFDSYPGDNNNYKSFFISVLKQDDGSYFYELIYDENKKHQARVGTELQVGDKWVVIDTDATVIYSKVGEWVWHDLGVRSFEAGNIVGDHFVFETTKNSIVVYDGSIVDQIFYCDLSKYPKNHQDCYRVTRKVGDVAYLKGRDPKIDVQNENRVVYYRYDDTEHKIVDVVIEDEIEKSYKVTNIPFKADIQTVKGNLMLFVNGDLFSPGLPCWYTFDAGELNCVDNDIFSGGYNKVDAAIFTENWQIMKDGFTIILRDLECFCDETGVCPLEDL